MANLNYHATKALSVVIEGQLRAQQLANDFYYHELKAGLAYNFPKKNSVLVGFGDYKTYTFPGNFKTPLRLKEFRIWEQLVLNNNFDRFKIEHRYRIEQRWVNSTFRQRFRYRFNPVVPLNHAGFVPKTLFITAFNEVFFTNKAPYFERNRFFGGLGYQFSKLFTMQLGFIRQYDYRTSDQGSGKNFIQTNFLFNVDHAQATHEKHPATID